MLSGFWILAQTINRIESHGRYQCADGKTLVAKMGVKAAILVRRNTLIRLNIVMDVDQHWQGMLLLAVALGSSNGLVEDAAANRLNVSTRIGSLLVVRERERETEREPLTVGVQTTTPNRCQCSHNIYYSAAETPTHTYICVEVGCVTTYRCMYVCMYVYEHSPQPQQNTYWENGRTETTTGKNANVRGRQLQGENWSEMHPMLVVVVRSLLALCCCYNSRATLTR